jgi:hypothetical protein
MKRVTAKSAEGAIKALVDAAKGPPEPPKHVRLRPEDMPFWDGVVRARARDEWTAADLVVGAQLARCQRDIEVESQALDDEGTVLRNDRGTQIANPRVSVLEQLARREMALMRTLRMGGRIAGDASKESMRRGMQAQAERLRDEMAEDELLAS